jgi:hypothetical protein
MLTAILLRGAYCTPVCSLLVRRELLERVGGVEERFTNLFEDQALLAKLHLAASSVVSGTRTAKYRRHPASTTARAIRSGEYDPGAPNRSRELFLTWLDGYVRSSDKVDAGLRAALDAALVPYRSTAAQWRWKARSAVRAALSPQARRLLVGLMRRSTSVGPVRMGSLRRLSPLAPVRTGVRLDDYYVEEFLGQNRHLISGRVLVVGDPTYARAFGGDRVSRTDVMPVEAQPSGGLSLADLACPAAAPVAEYDCILIVGGLERIHELSAAVLRLHRMLRPGGTLLATFPGIAPVITEGSAPTQWSLTSAAAGRLFGDVFGAELIEVTSFGNVLTVVAFLHGLTPGTLRPRELRVRDPQFPLLVSVRAGRPAENRSGRIPDTTNSDGQV